MLGSLTIKAIGTRQVAMLAFSRVVFVSAECFTQLKNMVVCLARGQVVIIKCILCQCDYQCNLPSYAILTSVGAWCLQAALPSLNCAAHKTHRQRANRRGACINLIAAAAATAAAASGCVECRDCGGR